MALAEYSKPPKPGAFQVKFFSGRGYAVVDGSGRPVGSFSHHQGQVEALCEARNLAADQALKRKERPCLCCGKSFPSEGIHNRLCNSCRGRDGGDAATYGLSIPRGRKGRG